MKPIRATLLLLIGLAAFVVSARAQAPDPPGRPESEAPAPLTAHRVGSFEATLTVRSDESEARRWADRFGFAGDLRAWDYHLTTERFALYVPADYAADDEPYGIVVWVSPTDDGSIPAELRPVFDDRRLIWIGARGSGNERHVFVRAGLALDAAANVRAAYRVDPGRVFVAGLSGGGRVAAMVAVAYPEVFTGGFPIIGVATYLDVPLESDPGRRVLHFPSPSDDVLERARAQPLVIMTGSGDFNREECRLTAAAYERDGFTDLHLIDVEGMGHQMPSPRSFAAGLDLLLGGARATRR